MTTPDVDENDSPVCPTCGASHVPDGLPSITHVVDDVPGPRGRKRPLQKASADRVSRENDPMPDTFGQFMGNAFLRAVGLKRRWPR